MFEDLVPIDLGQILYSKSFFDLKVHWLSQGFPFMSVSLLMINLVVEGLQAGTASNSANGVAGLSCSCIMACISLT
jgi:hypothetical protein